MKILSMTATFGKLERQSLSFTPGLNVIHAPNEWGKTTWCAFIEAMLYGVDTRERSTQTALAVKEKYAPWSGQPMSGRMDIHWNGRKITIERRTKGRIPFGEFSAYETDTGLAVPELTAANCGETLIGAERSVFSRTVFLKLTNLPVEEDEALRKRLNALVTTGDESGTSETLAAKLKALKNSCKHNKTGRLPEAENLRDSLQARLTQLQTLQLQTQRIRQQQTGLEERSRQLENHMAALACAENARQREKLAAAKVASATADSRLAALEQQCGSLPSEEEVQTALVRVRQLREQWDALTMDGQLLPELPQPPVFPSPFTGLAGADILRLTETNERVYRESLAEAKPGFKAYIPLLLAAAGVLLALIPHWIGRAAGVAALIAAVALYSSQRATRKRARDTVQALEEKYAPHPVENWMALAQKLVREQVRYEEASEQIRQQKAELDSRRSQLKATIDEFCQGNTLTAWEEHWHAVARQRQALLQARQEADRARELVAAMDSTQPQLPEPTFPDTLTFSGEQTRQLIEDTNREKQRLQTSLDQCLGQMGQLGSEEDLQRQLKAAASRVELLEDTDSALTVALETLTEASKALQRRFAPRISQQAQSLFSKLTGDRYDRLQWEQDMSVRLGAQGEVTMEKSAWRSDGTVDQLYLALRLAVAQELVPDAPVVLDDALVRFDDTRLTTALEILKEVSQSRQVILFTCQEREKKLLEDK